jgi:MFS family permease
VNDTTPTAYRDQDVHRFVFSRFLSTCAMQVQSVAIGWQIYDMEKTALSLGLVGLCQFAPMFLLTLPAGDISDRHDQRRVYAWAARLQSLCSLIFVGLTLFAVREVWAFYAVLVLFGAARGFAAPSGSSLLPFLVPPEKLPQAMAYNSSVFTVAVIAGPALGGFIYATGEPMLVYGLCFLFFQVAAFIVARLQGRRFTPEKSLASRAERVAEGVRFVKERPIVLGAISLDLFAVLLGGVTALLPIYAADILHVGPLGLGFLRSAPAMGACLTALYLARWPLKARVGPILFAAVAGFGVATIVFGLSTYFPLSLFCLFLLGATDMVSVNVRGSLVQLATPDAMRGRVSAVSMLFIGASNELGEFESGLTAAVLGTVPAVVVGGIGTLVVVGLWMKLFPSLRRVNSFDDVRTLA